MSKSFYKKIFYLVLASVLSLSMTSCVPLLVGAGAGAGVIGGKVALQDKTVGESMSDTTIWTKIKANFLREEVVEPGDINIEVNEGRVLLTGLVHSDEDMIKVLKIVWAQTGVREVINELKVKEGGYQTSAFDDMRDGWITTKIKTKLLFESEIRSSNYNIETIDCTVYIFGIAGNEEELSKVKHISESVANVKRVVSYVRIRKDLDQRVDDTIGSNAKIKKSSAITDFDETEKDDPDEGGETLENIFDDKL